MLVILGRNADFQIASNTHYGHIRITLKPLIHPNKLPKSPDPSETSSQLHSYIGVPRLQVYRAILWHVPRRSWAIKAFPQKPEIGQNIALSASTSSTLSHPHALPIPTASIIGASIPCGRGLCGDCPIKLVLSRLHKATHVVKRTAYTVDSCNGKTCMVSSFIKCIFCIVFPH